MCVTECQGQNLKHNNCLETHIPTFRKTSCQMWCFVEEEFSTNVFILSHWSTELNFLTIRPVLITFLRKVFKFQKKTQKWDHCLKETPAGEKGICEISNSCPGDKTQQQFCTLFPPDCFSVLADPLQRLPKPFPICINLVFVYYQFFSASEEEHALIQYYQIISETVIKESRCFLLYHTL